MTKVSQQTLPKALAEYAKRLSGHLWKITHLMAVFVIK
jgi:hypothetical protein